MKKLLCISLATLLAFNTVAQEIPGQVSAQESQEQVTQNEEIISDDNETIEVREKNERLNEEIYDILGENETLVQLNDAKDLILDEEDESDLDIIKAIPRDAWALVKAPAGWSKRQWIVASGAVSISTMIMVGDKRIADFFQANKSEFTEDVAFWAEKGGSQAHIGLAATYVVGTILKNKKLKKAATLAFSSMLISGVVVQGLKKVIGRTRPYATNSQWDFKGPVQMSSRHNSFPSGHTASAFAVAASIATVYDSKLVKILAYAAAALTGLSRVHDNKHWMSDVFMGAVIGTASGIFITKRHMNNNSKKKLQVYPTYINTGGQSGVGVGIRLRF